jgi:hypothetical protein
MMRRRRSSYWVYMSIEGSTVSYSVEFEPAAARFALCRAVLSDLHGGRLSRDVSGCYILEPVAEKVSIKAKTRLDTILHAPPPAYVLPLPEPTPYVSFETSIVVDTSPGTIILGLEQVHSTVITSTCRYVLEGAQPPQLLVAKHVIEFEPSMLMAYTWPVPSQVHGQGPTSRVLAELASIATACELRYNFNLYSWGKCLALAAEAMRSRSLLMSVTEKPIPFENAEKPVMLAFMSRNWASIAYHSSEDPVALARTALEKNVLSSKSLVSFSRLGDRLIISTHVPLLIRLRGVGVEYALRVVDEAAVADYGWHSFAIECRSCWRPIA